MADQEKKQYLSEDEMGFGAAAKPPKYLSEADMGLAPADGGFVASAKQSVGSLIKGTGQAAADFIPGVSQDNAVKQYGQSVIDANPTAVHSLGDITDKPVTAVKEAAGNAASSIGGMVGARVLGNAITAAAPLTGPLAPATAAVGQGVAWLGPWAAAALPSFGGIREQQIKDDPTRQDSLGSKALAAAGAGTVGLIENKFGPQEWALKALSQEGRKQLGEKFAAKTLAGSLGKGAAKGAAVEGAEELVQNPIEQLASYQNPTTAENLQDTAFSGAMGALGGGVFGGGMGAASRVMGGERGKTAQQADPAATQEAPTLALPAPPPSTGTPGEQLAASDAERAAQVAQAEARAAELYQQRDQFDAARQANQAGAPIPFDRTPAEELAAQRKAAMGIDPAAGPLSAAAAIAVESQAAEEVRLGAASVLAEGAARAQQAQAERAAWEAANPGIPYEPVQPARQESRPAPAAQQQPAGSFGAMNDFAELLSQERQDVAQRRAGIAERQGLRRDFDLAEADRRTAESMQREAQARRRAVLDAVLADPETKNPAGRFAATLRREGYRDSTPTEDELQTIQRFEDVRAAKPAPPEVEPSAPNELDPAAMGIRERRAPAPPKNLREGMARAQAARAAEGGSMPQAAQSTAAPSFDPGKAWASLSTQQRADLAGRLQGVPPIVSKNVPRAEWGKINPALRAKLAEAMQAPSTAVQAPSITAAAPNIPQENPNGTTRPDTAGVAAGRDPQGSVDARGVVDYGADGGGRAAGAVQRNAAAEPAAGVPGAGDRPVPAKVRKGRGGVLIEDERLARHADSLEFMAEDAGWQEVGGRLVRDAAGNAAGRTKWLPRAPWFQAGMQGDPQALAESVRKAASGQPIPSRDMRTIQAMMDWLDAQENGGTLDEDSSAAEWERIGYNEASPEEQAAFDAIDIFLDSVAINEIDAMRALGFTEDEIRAEIEAAERKGRPGEAVAGGAQERAQDDREGARDEAPAVLESYSEKDLADRAEAQRLSDERKANEERRLEEKAQADAARDTFTLTGSDRPADVLATQGQGGLFDQQAPAANQNPIKTETRAKTEAAAGPASANQETPVIGRMVSRLGETPSQQYRNSFGPSGETQAWEPREFTMRRSDWDALQKVASGRSGTKNGTKLTIELEDVEDRVRDALTVQSLHQTVTSMKVAVSRLRTVWDQAASQARQEAEAPASATPSVGEAPSQLEALFSDLNSTSTRKANKARKAAAKLPEAARIEYVQANFHDLLIQLMDSGSLEVNGTTTLTEDNASCL